MEDTIPTNFRQAFNTKHKQKLSQVPNATLHEVKRGIILRKQPLFQNLFNFIYFLDLKIEKSWEKMFIGQILTEISRFFRTTFLNFNRNCVNFSLQIAKI